MIIFKKQFEKVNTGDGAGIKEGPLFDLMNEAGELVKRADKGVVSERSPITLVEKMQINDTVKLVKKLMIDLDRDVKKGRDTDKDADRLRKAVTALRTSIDNIL
jgi:hypothetical protein